MRVTEREKRKFLGQEREKGEHESKSEMEKERLRATERKNETGIGRV